MWDFTQCLAFAASQNNQEDVSFKCLKYLPSGHFRPTSARHHRHSDTYCAVALAPNQVYFYYGITHMMTLQMSAAPKAHVPMMRRLAGASSKRSHQ